MIEGRHKYLSTAWLEHFHCTDKQIQMRGVAEALKVKLKLLASARICVLNVGKAIQSCQQLSGVDIEVWLLGEPDDPSHTGIYGHKDIEADPDPSAILSRLVKPADVFCVPADLL